MNKKTYSLSAHKRGTEKHSAREERKQKRVPAVVYGKGVDPVAISLDGSELLKVYREAGHSSLVDLDVDGEKMKVIIHILDRHPVRDSIYHVDFYAVNLKEKTNVTIPFKFVGEAPAVKDQDGLFISEHDEVEIRCLPTEIPHEIEVDITPLKEINDNLTLADLNLDTEKYEILSLEPESVLCSVIMPKEEKIEEEAPEAEEVPVEGETAEEGEAKEEGEGEEKKEESEEGEGKKEE
ncbi:50S ribosomal protein L25 [Candidatus Gracilibacteria bacterium]|nr:50S ribosomal protein L25 [Candidatus Gracilibacteria bacterium]MCF7819345.1 50S ribosomal protein L25 [Candidatus Gracilibacteria bacterium]